VNPIDTGDEFDMEHMHQFVTWWELVSHFHLHHDVPNKINWKFTKDDRHSTSSAHKIKFKGLIARTLNA
jgi:hypothetical protein